MKELAGSTAWQDQLTVNLVNASGQSLTNGAINGGNLADALRNSLVNQVHGMAASHIKELEKYYVAHKLAHALAGCGAGAAVGGRCADGAIGAAVGEMVAELVDKPSAFASEKEWQAYRANALGLSKITAGAITAYAGGNAQTAINSADTAVKNNYLLLREAEEKAILERQLRGGQLSSDEQLRIAARLDQLNGVDLARDQAIREACPSGSKGSAACGALVGTAQEALKMYGENVTYSLLYKDLYPRDARNLESILQGLDANSIVRDQAIAAIASTSGISWATAANRYDSAMMLHTVTATLAGYYGLQSITAPSKIDVPNNSEAAFSRIVPGGGLQAHENVGGHLLSKHVGQSEQALMNRLAAEPRISGSSSFYNRATAENAVSQVLDTNQAKITDWLNSSGGRLRLDHTLPDPAGISVTRGSADAVDVNSARVILVRDPSTPIGYKILTGFPTKP
ncbi:RNase A-like domain-containing protein [Zobellella sp. DQSA1]|uniref:RNase A-like domain-containing protein n=1 Tax=Zobellella sp. DQSA1 TaxID=3342386 RepID=UPI0035BEBF90